MGYVREVRAEAVWGFPVSYIVSPPLLICSLHSRGPRWFICMLAAHSEEGEMGIKVGIPTSYIPLAKLDHRVTDSYKRDWAM